ncbi:hypothetical protein [Terrihalobacillus insolitus]|uniref:hypothetical protein n=1 Tax=Terrihalobacillus insolitus TaxID=2950438 RepID=UPI002341CCBB|nr:hypothetical protein [Terrihalobacillus insolitus]MDC3414249.1 hypothetical protein [Terrihalobacillus insolitus]
MTGKEIGNMAGSCPYCENGQEKVVQMRNGNITETYEDCLICYGTGALRRGRPDGLMYDVGITDPTWEDDWS